MSDTTIDHLDAAEFATITSNERKWITRVLKIKQKYPDEVQILRQPEDNFGYMLAHVPKTWMKVAPQRKIFITEEQRAARAAILADARKKRG